MSLCGGRVVMHWYLFLCWWMPKPKQTSRIWRGSHHRRMMTFHLLLVNFIQFHNIMVILGKQKNEMAAVHLMNSYCLLSLLYACETWSLKASSVHSANVALNNSFRRIFNCCWRESPKMLLFYCCVLPLYTMSMSIAFFSTKSWSVTAVLYSGYLQKFVILKFCQLQTNIIFIVWTCLLARSDAVPGRYLRTV